MINFVCESSEWQKKMPNFESVAQKSLEFVVDDISVVLADNKFVQDLNHQFRGKDSPTNVLSFESDEEGYLGDVIFAFETVKSEALEQNKDFSDHFSHLLIHGALHLMGYDHEEDSQAEEMEEREIKLLAKLGIANPYETA